MPSPIVSGFPLQPNNPGVFDDVLKKCRRVCFVWASSPTHFCPQLALAVLIKRYDSPWANHISCCLQLGGKFLLYRSVCIHDHVQHGVTVLSPSIFYLFESFEHQDTQNQPD